MRLLERGSVVVLTAPDDLFLEDGDGARPGEVHGVYNHLLEVIVGNVIAFNVEEEVFALNVAAVGEVHAKIELDSELGRGVRVVHDCLYVGAKKFLERASMRCINSMSFV
jgi:hypothetical protein